MKITADQFRVVFINLLQTYAQLEGDGEIDWNMSIMDFDDLLDYRPIDVTIEE